MKFACLFSGSGALTYGLQLAGHEPVVLVEIAPYARAVLRKNFPGVLMYRDITSVSKIPEDVGLLTAGFPCSDASRLSLSRQAAQLLLLDMYCAHNDQPAVISRLPHFQTITIETKSSEETAASVAAAQPESHSLQGRRTGLFGHVIRLLKNHRRVPWVLLENVKGILDCDRREELDTGAPRPPIMAAIFTELEALGYNVASRVVDLRGFGLPHMRERVFVLASLHGDPRDILLGQRGKSPQGNVANTPVCDGSCVLQCGGYCYRCFLKRASEGPDESADCNQESGQGKPHEERTVTCKAHKTGFVIDLAEKLASPQQDMMPTITTANGKRICLVPSVPRGQTQQPARYLTAEEVEVLFGLPPGWSAIDAKLPENRRGLSSLSESALHRIRYHMLGGSVPVNMAEWLGNRLLPHNMYSIKHMGDAQSDVRMEPPHLHTWPNASYSIGNSGRYEAKHVGSFPVVREFVPLFDLLVPSGEAVRTDALVAWRDRMKKQQWTLQPGLSAALSCLCNRDTYARRRPIPDWIGEVGFLADDDFSLWPSLFLDPADANELKYIPRYVLNDAKPIRKLKHVIPADDGMRLALLLGRPQQEWRVSSHVHCVPYAPFRHIVLSADIGKHSGLQARSSEQLQAAIDEADKRSKAQQSGGPSDLRASQDTAHSWPEDEGSVSAAKQLPSGLPPACGRCNICVRDRRHCVQCMMVVAGMAAAGGHPGAELTVKGEKAVGSRVEVYWTVDDEWFSGTLTCFCPLSLCHTVSYDDGDEELARLWLRHVRQRTADSSDAALGTVRETNTDQEMSHVPTRAAH